MSERMRARYLSSFGRHRPRCHGRCLVAEVDPENNAVPASICLIVTPTIIFALLVPWSQFALLGSVALMLSALALFSLGLAAYTEPGLLHVDAEVPRERRGRRHRITHVIVDGERHELGTYRAKMCRQTENCVEEFDHYCPWVGNAVGRRNYRYFVAFIATTSFLALVVGASAVLRLVDLKTNTSSAERHKPVIALTWGEVLLMVLIAYTIIVLCSVCGLLCFHGRLIAINQTTNENIRGTYFSLKNPHDKGTCQNYKNFAFRPVPRSRVVSYVGGRDGKDEAVSRQDSDLEEAKPCNTPTQEEEHRNFDDLEENDTTTHGDIELV